MKKKAKAQVLHACHPIINMGGVHEKAKAIGLSTRIGRQELGFLLSAMIHGACFVRAAILGLIIRLFLKTEDMSDVEVIDQLVCLVENLISVCCFARC